MPSFIRKTFLGNKYLRKFVSFSVNFNNSNLTNNLNTMIVTDFNIDIDLLLILACFQLKP